MHPAVATRRSLVPIHATDIEIYQLPITYIKAVVAPSRDPRLAAERSRNAPSPERFAFVMPHTWICDVSEFTSGPNFLGSPFLQCCRRASFVTHYRPEIRTPAAAIDTVDSNRLHVAVFTPSPPMVEVRIAGAQQTSSRHR